MLDYSHSTKEFETEHKDDKKLNKAKGQIFSKLHSYQLSLLSLPILLNTFFKKIEYFRISRKEF